MHIPYTAWGVTLSIPNTVQLYRTWGTDQPGQWGDTAVWWPNTWIVVTITLKKCYKTPNKLRMCAAHPHWRQIKWATIHTAFSVPLLWTMYSRLDLQFKQLHHHSELPYIPNHLSPALAQYFISNTSFLYRGTLSSHTVKYLDEILFQKLKLCIWLYVTNILRFHIQKYYRQPSFTPPRFNLSSWIRV